MQVAGRASVVRQKKGRRDGRCGELRDVQHCTEPDSGGRAFSSATASKPDSDRKGQTGADALNGVLL